jgi:hypothetical protein
MYVKDLLSMVSSGILILMVKKVVYPTKFFTINYLAGGLLIKV